MLFFSLFINIFFLLCNFQFQQLNHFFLLFLRFFATETPHSSTILVFSSLNRFISVMMRGSTDLEGDFLKDRIKFALCRYNSCISASDSNLGFLLRLDMIGLERPLLRSILESGFLIMLLTSASFFFSVLLALGFVGFG